MLPEDSRMDEENPNISLSRRRTPNFVSFPFQTKSCLIEESQNIAFHCTSASFQKQWALFTTILHPHIQFVFLLPRPLTMYGEQILSNGRFYISLLSLLKNCKTICTSILLSQAQRLFTQRIVTHRSEYEAFLCCFVEGIPENMGTKKRKVSEGEFKLQSERQEKQKVRGADQMTDDHIYFNYF